VKRRAETSRARLFAPEVVQTSAMDCGPAALACLLKGFGIPASYPRLQEACSTDVDGTSINTIEQIAVALGLEVDQIMLPVDHLLLPAAHALPALLVVRRDNLAHFLVAWRRHGPLVQLMDPAKGRRWLRVDALRDELYVHQQQVPPAAWREWAGSRDFLGCLRQRMQALGMASEECERILAGATEDPGWLSLAVLDAAVRMTADLVRGDGLRRGPDAAGVVKTIVRRAGEGGNVGALVPAAYWSVVPAPSGADALQLRGAVLLRARGRRDTIASDPHRTAAPTVHDVPERIARVLTDRSRGPLAEAWSLLRADGHRGPLTLAAAALLAAAGAMLEVSLLRGALEIGNVLHVREHRLVTVGFVLAVVGALLLLDMAISAGILRLGRRLETRLRAALLAKLPTLGDSYFRSRLVSDLAHRAHSIDALRSLPELGARFLRTSSQLLFSALALAWLDPASAWLALLSAACALSIPLAAQRLLAERELRQRSHAAALSRHYLDSLLGLTAARTHAAERPLRQRHEGLLVEWGRSSVQLLRGGVVIEGLQMLVGSMLAVWLVLAFVGRGSQPGSTLLFVYWALNLPLLGRELAGIIRQFPAYRNILARVCEPLAVPADTPEAPAASAEPDAAGVALRFDGVGVRAGGQDVLSGIALTIEAGEHVAIVGRSGAGKSTLAGLLLGWHKPSQGVLLADGAPLEGERLAALRRQTAWVDPAVHLWNRSLFDNLRYGDPTRLTTSIGSVIETASLTAVLEKLPAGLQSPLGEGGGLTSGGEGQRVRFGRALLREPARLAILDEPFRGLDSRQRDELLARARDVWRDATLVCVTHDIEQTLSFERVIVLESGRVVEDGEPALLCSRPGSAYAALLEAERAVRAQLWSNGRWRRWRMRGGAIVERAQTQAESEWTIQSTSRGL
jgi:ABC-type bacteriocin/lantibiotic exporter with double-glycine peptidase domain